MGAAAMKGAAFSASLPDSGASTRAQVQGGAADTFAALHAERMGPGPAVAEVPASRPAERAAPDRPLSLGDVILNTMDRMGKSASEHWAQVAAPLNPEVGLNSADLLNRQMHLQRFMLEVEFASLLSKQAAKTVDQISRTQ